MRRDGTLRMVRTISERKWTGASNHHSACARDRLRQFMIERKGYRFAKLVANFRKHIFQNKLRALYCGTKRVLLQLNHADDSTFLRGRIHLVLQIRNYSNVSRSALTQRKVLHVSRACQARVQDRIRMLAQ